MTAKLAAQAIRFRPRKKRSLLVGCIINLFLATGFFWLSLQLDFGSGKFLFFVLSITSVLALSFGVAGFVRLKREGFIGLFISGEGINDISTGHTYGMVQWKDVYKIKVVDDVEHPKYKYIILKVQNPQAYIDRERVGIKRRSMVLKFHYYGSPICFSNRALQCTFDELYELVTKYYENYQTRKTEREESLLA